MQTNSAAAIFSIGRREIFPPATKPFVRNATAFTSSLRAYNIHTHTHIHVYKHCITRAYVFIIISFLLFIPVRLPRCRSTEPSDAGTPFVVPAHVKIRRKYFTFRSARAPRRQRRGATSRGIHFEIRTLVRPGSGE